MFSPAGPPIVARPIERDLSDYETAPRPRVHGPPRFEVGHFLPPPPSLPHKAHDGEAETQPPVDPLQDEPQAEDPAVAKDTPETKPLLPVSGENKFPKEEVQDQEPHEGDEEKEEKEPLAQGAEGGGAVEREMGAGAFPDAQGCEGEGGTEQEDQARAPPPPQQAPPLYAQLQVQATLAPLTEGLFLDVSGWYIYASQVGSLVILPVAYHKGGTNL